MFIENLRRTKKKWRVGIGILLGLIVISLLATFSYAGNSVNTGSVPTETTVLAEAEAVAENAAEAAKNAANDVTIQGKAAAAYLSLAGYQALYLEDTAKAYEQAGDYARNMISACGTVENPDYETAYDYLMKAQFGLGDAQSVSAAFNESLKVVEINETYLNSYFNMMTALNANEQFITDMDAVQAKLKPLADKEPKADKNADKGKEDKAGDTEKTPSELMDYAAELVQQATVAQNSQE